MRLGAWVSAALCALALSTALAHAEPPGAALGLYAAGDYVAAADLAEQNTQSADSLAFAARALLAACVVDGNNRDVAAMLGRAERGARAALEIDPRSVEARLQLAIVFGMRGRRASLPEAFALGYAPRGRRLIDEALTLAPDSAEAAALLGAWHLEVIRRGGGTGAITYGARVAEGLAAFERARELAPDNGAIALQYAVALTELDAPGHAQRIGELLNAVLALSPHDALEAYSHGVAARFAAALETGGPHAAARLAHAMFR